MQYSPRFTVQRVQRREQRLSTLQNGTEAQQSEQESLYQDRRKLEAGANPLSAQRANSSTGILPTSASLIVRPTAVHTAHSVRPRRLSRFPDRGASSKRSEHGSRTCPIVELARHHRRHQQAECSCRALSAQRAPACLYLGSGGINDNITENTRTRDVESFFQ